jgi:hypothetical protein
MTFRTPVDSKNKPRHPGSIYMELSPGQPPRVLSPALGAKATRGIQAPNATSPSKNRALQSSKALYKAPATKNKLLFASSKPSIPVFTP